MLPYTAVYESVGALGQPPEEKYSNRVHDSIIEARFYFKYELHNFTKMVNLLHF